MKDEPVVVRVSDREWETWLEGERDKGGGVHWKTLLSSDLTSSTAMTMGILKIPVSKSLGEHRHAQAEVYFILQGCGIVTVDGESRRVEAGCAVFIPGYASHSCENTGDVELRFAYVFPTDSFEEIEYVFN